MRLRQKIPAGLTDAGLASLATFAIGIFAARRLEASALGVYALVFTAFLLAATVPAQLLLTPAEIHVVGHDPRQRLAVVRRTLALGSAGALVPALVAMLAAYVAVPRGADGVFALLLTGGACSILSPLQDHIRRLLHLGDRSWDAALVSLVQLAVVAGGLIAARDRVPDEWVPFGALALANAASTAVGWWLCRRHHAPLERSPQLLSLLRSGRWLLVYGLMPSVALFIASTAVTRLASPEALGQAEGARVVAMPVIVLAQGLFGALSPRAMEAGHGSRPDAGRQVRRVFVSLIALGALGYGLVVSVDWPGNVGALVVPVAYEVPGLVALTLVASALHGLPFIDRGELLGGRREAVIARVESLGALGMVVGGLTAALTGAYARPIGFGIQSVAQLGGYQRARRRMYRSDDDRSPAA